MMTAIIIFLLLSVMKIQSLILHLSFYLDKMDSLDYQIK